MSCAAWRCRPPSPEAAEHRLPNGVTALRSLRRFCLHSSLEATVAQQELPGGAWLASLEWLVRAGQACTMPAIAWLHGRAVHLGPVGWLLLADPAKAIYSADVALFFLLCLQGLPYRIAAAAADTGVLSSSSVPQLQCFCCSGWPEQAAAGGDEQGDCGWGAFWGFLTHHPALCCVTVGADSVPGSAATPNTAAVDALLQLFRPSMRCRTRRRDLQIVRMPQAAGEGQSVFFGAHCLRMMTCRLGRGPSQLPSTARQAAFHLTVLPPLLCRLWLHPIPGCVPCLLQFIKCE